MPVCLPHAMILSRHQFSMVVWVHTILNIRIITQILPSLFCNFLYSTSFFPSKELLSIHTRSSYLFHSSIEFHSCSLPCQLLVILFKRINALLGWAKYTIYVLHLLNKSLRLLGLFSSNISNSDLFIFSHSGLLYSLSGFINSSLSIPPSWYRLYLCLKIHLYMRAYTKNSPCSGVNNSQELLIGHMPE